MWTLILLVGWAPTFAGQTLARRGWVGSGMTIEPWWKGAVFYELDPLAFQDSSGDGFGDLDGITLRLDYLASLGVDAIVLSPFQLPASPDGRAASRKSALDAAYGTEEDFDRLQRETSLRKIRLIVDLPLSGKRSLADTISVARFWLSRGVGGLRLTTEPDDAALASLTPQEREERVRQLRRLCAGYVGERVLFWDIPGVPRADHIRGLSAPPGEAPQLAVDHALAELHAWDQAGLRAYLNSGAELDEVIVSDATDRLRSSMRLKPAAELTGKEMLGVEKTVAAALFLGRDSPMLFFGQELGMAQSGSAPAPMQWGGDKGFTTGVPWIEMGPNAATANVELEDANPDSLLNWYRRLSALVHVKGSLHGGTLTLVETGYPDVVAWVRKGATGKESPVLAICNLSNRPVLISLTEALNHLSMRANSGIEPLAVSYSGNPAYTASGISLPAYGVYVGELIQPGLEDSPSPAMPHKRGR